MVKFEIKQNLRRRIVKNMFNVIVLASFMVLSPSVLMAKGNCPDQGPRMTAQAYAARYGAEARRQMKKYGVPASITLAQGIFESGYGASYIAVVANNHFGIKAYRADWKGAVVYCDDDAAREPFCKFTTVEQGYEYHSTFLKGSSRYASLFKLDPTDYEGWARGLKRCGYATSSTYAERLIKIIEENHLDVYDTDYSAVGYVTSAVAPSNVSAPTTTTTWSIAKKHQQNTVVSSTPTVAEQFRQALSVHRHKLYLTSKKRGLHYTVARANDNLSLIALEFNVSVRKLRKWNDLTRKSQLHEGDIIYLQSKKKRASSQHKMHTVKGGESLWSISQQYGVKVESLVKRNKLASANVAVGQELRLR